MGSSVGPDATHAAASKTAFPSVNIIGAGIAGLSLACHLRRRRIKFNIFDAASKPKGHHYGITISPWGYKDLLGSLEPKLNVQTFRELTAADRLVGGQGFTTASSKKSRGQDAADDFRASDMALREVLAKGHQVNWNHKVVSAERVSDGLKLKFENGKDSIANITIDAGGERSGLLALLLPDLKPDILPYAVYHGSRYIPQSTFEHKFSSVFDDGENVKNFPPQPNTPSSWHLQIAKTYMTKDQIPSKIQLPDTDNANKPVVELRYTFSRPAKPTSQTQPTDPLYNPTRSPQAAKETPDELFTELSTYLSSSPHLPHPLPTLLDANGLRQDRILNWLMRLKPQLLAPQNLQTLASQGVVAVGDSIHATPPLSSEGASHAMADAANVADWIEGLPAGGDHEQDIVRFYETRSSTWSRVLDEATARLQGLHGSRASGGQEGKLSGRI